MCLFFFPSTSVRGKQGFSESQSGLSGEHGCVRVCVCALHPYIMYVCFATRLCVSLCTYVCIHRCYLTFMADDSLQTSHGVRGPARLLSWKQVLERADLLSVSSSDCWDIDLASALRVSVCVSRADVSCSDDLLLLIFITSNHFMRLFEKRIF